MATSKRNPLGITKYDSADYIKDFEGAHHYLAATLEDDDLAQLMRALNTVCRALGVAKVAKAAGLTRDGLYKALAAGSRPSFTTINGVLKAFDIDLLPAAAKTYRRARSKPSQARAA